MKIQTISVSLITSLMLLGENFLPVQAQKAAVNPPSSSLVSAISQTIRKFSEFLTTLVSKYPNLSREELEVIWMYYLEYLFSVKSLASLDHFTF